MGKTITLRCPNCKKVKRFMPREVDDPKTATVCELLCESCCDTLGANNPDVFFFDVKGNRVKTKWEPT